MEYISTRGYGPVNFETALTHGLAPDGGLYVPVELPHFNSDQLQAMRGQSYQDIAFSVIWPFVAGEMAEDMLRQMIADSYTTFNHPDITPLKELKPGLYMLELFHGPTLAFKDVALQLLGRLLAWSLEKSGRKATVLGATSGDTGPAALAGIAGLNNIEAFILFPHNRVSDIQRRQMTTLSRPNVHPIAIEGTFDDCQHIVKDLFADVDLVTHAGLTAVNSISWARLLPQMVYYFYALSRLPEGSEPYFAVPTGNFGDVFAGYIAKKCGLPCGKMIVATNQNDILTRFIRHGDYSLHEVKTSFSPSMDIQVASNFERLLFDAVGRDPERIKTMMTAFKQTGTLPPLGDDEMAVVNDNFLTNSVGENETLAYIHEAYERFSEVIDPHTAVGLGAAMQRENLPCHVVLATASAAKFPDAVHKGCGVYPELPEKMKHVLTQKENFAVLPAQADKVKSVLQEYLN